MDPVPANPMHVAFRTSPAAAGLVDEHDLWVDPNRALLALAESPLDHMLGAPLRHFVDPKHHEILSAGLAEARSQGNARVAVDFIRSDSTTIEALLHFVACADGLIVHVTNLTAQRRSSTPERPVLDPSGAYNRAVLFERLETALRTSAREGTPVAVAIVGLDHFKKINDARGRPWGDRILRAVAKRLKDAVSENDTVARVGGDEFAVLIEDEAPIPTVAKIVDSFNEPIEVSGQSFPLTASVGIAIGDAGDSANGLLRDADDAMYKAKEEGRARYHLYGEAEQAAAAHRTQIETAVRAAVSREEILVWYQPIVDINTLAPVAVECLARWHRIDGTFAAAGDFFPVIERLGLAAQVNTNLLRQLRTEAPLLAARGVTRAHVNLGPDLLVLDEITQGVTDILDDGYLTEIAVEISAPDVLAVASSSIDALLDLRARGVLFVIDDFGPGASSLDVIMSTGPNMLKIHQMFVAGIDQPAAEAIVRGLTVTCNTLGIDVIAEGVENDTAIAALRELRVGYAQGVHVGRPEPLNSLTIDLT